MLPLVPAFVVRNIVHPIYRGLRGDRLFEQLEELERSQWLSRSELEDAAWRRLAEIVSYAAAHVPYYRDLFEKAGFSPASLQGPADFRRIPLLGKDEIRAAGNRIITTDPLRHGIASSTGGSTGEPLYFHVDAAAGTLRRAGALRAHRWAGIDTGDRQAIFWGTHLDSSLRERLFEGFRRFVNNILLCSTFDMSERSMSRYAADLRRFKPALIMGYPSALALFADFLRKRSLHPCRPKAVITSGEQLYESQRALIEGVFGCPVFDRYGSREFALVAQECSEHRGLHVMSDLLYVEVLRGDGSPADEGEEGELVVTDLENRYMPFIRYRTGDLAVPTGRSCACGRGLALLERLEGRSFDAIVTADGRAVGGFFWTWLSRAVPGILRFQVEQRQRGAITFRIVPGPEWRPEHQDQLAARIRETCGADFRVEFAIVHDIPLTPSGKSTFIVSRIEERYVVKSKIHKARVSREEPAGFDSIVIDEELMELADIAPGERVLIVDATNGSRVETFAVKGSRGSGEILVSGAAALHVRAGDEIGIMAFTWTEGVAARFSNILVDDRNRFVRYLTEIAGERL